jgi:hypothetical protein
VPRLALAIVVALLTFSVSGVSALILPEPCTAYAQPGQEDNSCAPTCLTCGCCAQAVEPVALPVTVASGEPRLESVPFAAHIPRTRSREILHVPKPRLA